MQVGSKAVLKLHHVLQVRSVPAMDCVWILVLEDFPCFSCRQWGMPPTKTRWSNSNEMAQTPGSKVSIVSMEQNGWEFSNCCLTCAKGCTDWNETSSIHCKDTFILKRRMEYFPRLLASSVSFTHSDICADCLLLMGYCCPCHFVTITYSLLVA
jgi:hypothetical protein